MCWLTEDTLLLTPGPGMGGLCSLCGSGGFSIAGGLKALLGGVVLSPTPKGFLSARGDSLSGGGGRQGSPRSRVVGFFLRSTWGAEGPGTGWFGSRKGRCGDCSRLGGWGPGRVERRLTWGGPGPGRWGGTGGWLLGTFTDTPRFRVLSM